MMNNKVRVFIGGTAAAFLLVACSQPDEPVTDTDAATAGADVEAELVEYLFVQHADKVSLANNVLTLEGIGDEVLYFSDRPDRIVGRETLEAFIDDWDEGDESFAVIPPNAIVTIVRRGEALDLVVVLAEPTMVGDNSLTYNVKVLDGPDSGVGNNAAVFIDAFGHKPGGESRLGRPGRPGDPGGLRNGAEAGRPGDPGGLRDGDKPNVDANVSGKRGREGTRQFRSSGGSVDRKL